MPLANELLPLLARKLKVDYMMKWLADLSERVGWLSGAAGSGAGFTLNIEEVFHLAHFDIEAHRLRQHCAPVGRRDGPDTPWRQGERIETWLENLEKYLIEVIFECDERAQLEPIARWAEFVSDRDSVITFNYDTLVERALTSVRKNWNHGTPQDPKTGIPVFKLHGSVDWIVADCGSKFDSDSAALLFAKQNSNQRGGSTGHVEDDRNLYRYSTRELLRDWVGGHDDMQQRDQDGFPPTPGIAGLGAYKELHRVPGLGLIWANAMRAAYESERLIAVGFSMSDFDAMAQMQFARVAMDRAREQRQMHFVVLDPSAKDEGFQRRFGRVFRDVVFIATPHESFDWTDPRLDP